MIAKQNFIFDLDGTLVDSLPGITRSINDALPAGVTRVTNLRPFIGPPVRSILNSLAHSPNDRELDQMELRFRQSYDADGWRQTAEFLGARELLEQLRVAGKRIFLVTNKPSRPTERILSSLRLRAYFEDLLTPDSRTPPFRGKDQMLRHLVDTHALHAEECLMVGDTAEDCAAAAALAMPVAFVAHGYGDVRATATFPNCQIFPDLGMISTNFLTDGAAL